MQIRSQRLSRSDAFALLAIIALGVCTTIVAVRMPSMAGSYEDDGIYMTTAKSLAEGNGYRHPQLPGQPWQTKYPILYPLTLSLVWRVWPSFPPNLAAMQALNGIFGTAALCVAFLLLRRAWKLPIWIAGGAALLTAVHVNWLAMTRVTLSEHLYTMLSFAALLAVITPDVRTPTESAPKSHSIARALFAGLLAACAYLARSIGISVIAAVVAHYLFRRRWRDAACAGGVGGLAIVGCEIWRRVASTWNALIPQSDALRYDLDYGLWLPGSFADFGWMLYHKTGATLYWVFSELTQPPEGWVGEQLRAGLDGAPWFYVLLGATALACVMGLIVTLRRGTVVCQLYLLFYLGLVAIWPFDTFRFFVPILPLLLAAALVGCGWVLATFAKLPMRLFRKPDRYPPSGSAGSRGQPYPTMLTAFTLLIAAVLLIHYGTATVQLVRQIDESTPAGGVDPREAVARMIAENTPPEAVIACYQAGYFHLMTGRTCVPFLPSSDPIAYFYPPDRRWDQFGVVASRDQAHALRQLLKSALSDYYPATGVTHVLSLNTPSGEGAVFRQFRKNRPDTFRPVAGIGSYRLHAIK